MLPRRGETRRPAERTITKRENGKVEDKIERSIALVTDKPLVLTHSISLEKQPIATAAITYPHINVYLPEEFMPLIEKHVRCSGTFRKTFNPHDHEIEFHIDTASESDHLSHQLKTFFYEPEEVELRGILYEEVYPGPPEYTSVKMGDRPEKAVFLTLKEPINVELKKNTELEEDILNTPEKGVRELQVVFFRFSTFSTSNKTRSLAKRNPLSCAYGSSPPKNTHDGK